MGFDEADEGVYAPFALFAQFLQGAVGLADPGSGPDVDFVVAPPLFGERLQQRLGVRGVVAVAAR